MNKFLTPLDLCGPVPTVAPLFNNLIWIANLHSLHIEGGTCEIMRHVKLGFFPPSLLFQFPDYLSRFPLHSRHFEWKIWWFVLGRVIKCVNWGVVECTEHIVLHLQRSSFEFKCLQSGAGKFGKRARARKPDCRLLGKTLRRWFRSVPLGDPLGWTIEVKLAYAPPPSGGFRCSLIKKYVQIYQSTSGVGLALSGVVGSFKRSSTAGAKYYGCALETRNWVVF